MWSTVRTHTACVAVCPCVHAGGGVGGWGVCVCCCQGDAMVTRCQPTSWRLVSRRSAPPFVLHLWWQAALMPPSIANWTRQHACKDRRSVWRLSDLPNRSFCSVCVCVEKKVKGKETERGCCIEGWSGSAGGHELYMNPICSQGSPNSEPPPKNSWLHSPHKHADRRRETRESLPKKNKKKNSFYHIKSRGKRLLFSSSSSFSSSSPTSNSSSGWMEEKPFILPL